jgi:hypothetical protein
MGTKFREKSAEKKTLLIFVNVIQKFRKAVKICEPPHTQVGH